MKKIILAVACVALSAGAFARPFHGHGGFHHHAPIHHHWHHGGHHHGGFWGRGGCHFWPGFVGGVVGGVVGSTIVHAAYDPAPVVVTSPAVVQQPVVVQQQPVVVQQQPVVVQQPVVQPQNVWVEGRYVDQVQPNGSVVRTWSPGHYEARTVVVQ